MNNEGINDNYKNSKQKKLVFIIVCVISLASLCLYMIGKKNTRASFQNEEIKQEPSQIEENNDDNVVKQLKSLEDYKFYYAKSSETKTVNVLVILIDPLIQSGDCKGIRVTRCLDNDSMDPFENIEYQVKLFEKASNNLVHYNIIKIEEEKNFSQNIEPFKLSNGETSFRMDEETLLEIKNYSSAFWDSPLFLNLPAFSLDYEYYINKYDLINRRNNNEFDEVWLAGDPTIQAYESVMIGNNSYWINGPAILKKCSPFKLLYLNLSREDSFIESFGHAVENIMSNVFNAPLSYGVNVKNVSVNNYNNINLWEKFTLTEYMNSNKGTGLSGPGNVHFSPNSIEDYDWNNMTNKITSRYAQWENYPYFNSKTSIFTPNVYSNIVLPIGNNRNPIVARHLIWWFNLMPHVNGYTENGYSNNWWNYIISGDYILNISSEKSLYSYNIGDKINNLTFSTVSYFGKKEIYKEQNYKENMSFSDETLINVDINGNMYAVKQGLTNMNYCRDNKCISVQIEIK